ncbi:MAG: BamA/TamA family outer membrane protein [Bacteroidia bacterium]
MGGFLTLALLWTGCATNRYIPEGQYLLKGEPTFSKTGPVDSSMTLQERLEALREIGESTVDPDLLWSSVKTHPNRRMIWPKTYLHLYNLGVTLSKYEYPPERWLRFFRPNNHIVDSIASFLIRTAGEPPVIIDSAQLRQDIANLKTVYFSQGFFHAQIRDSIDTCTAKINRQKANVIYLITEGKAAIIDKIRPPLVADEAMRRVLINNLNGSLLRTGDNYVEDNFTAERARITSVMRNNGYYTFNPKMIYFEIDTLPPDTLGTVPNNEAIKEYSPIWIQAKIQDTIAPFKVGRISMIIEPATYDPAIDDVMKVVSPGMMTDSLRKAWRLSHDHYSDSSKITFITYERVLERLNLNFLEKLITLNSGETYSLTTERKTQMRLQNLGIFKYVLIKPTVDELNHVVDFTIQTTLMRRFQAKVGMEGFFQQDPILKSNLPGVGAEVTFRDKLLFKGAEKLDLSAKGDVRFYQGDTVISNTVVVAGDTSSTNDTVSKFYRFLQGSVSLSLQFPRIFAPGLVTKNLQAFEPATSFILTASRQSSRDYDRNAVNLDWNYRWFHSSINKKAQSSFSPYVVALIQSNLKQRLLDQILNIGSDDLRRLILQDFRRRFSSWGDYKFTYNNAASNSLRHNLSLVANAQMGGNTPYLIDRFLKVDGNWKDYRLGSLFYGQFLKLSAEVKNNFPIGRHASFVTRSHIGIAKPWNYSRFVPFESRFFSGGANSMRGWQSNTLGPGTFSIYNAPLIKTDTGFVKDPNWDFKQSQIFLAPGGEFLFETNLELRADVYKWIKVAIFSDIGNVWFLPNSTVDFTEVLVDTVYNNPKLSSQTAFKLGIDAGIGLRLDFDFFLFRVDLAKQIYAPDLPGFVINSKRDHLGGKRIQLNFGIGYPF